MQNRATENSAEKPIFSKKALVRLIVPLIIEQFLLLSVGMADTLMVTTAGEAAVSGVSLVDNINMLLIQIFAALSTGGAVVVSQYLGSGKKESAQRSAKQLMYTTTVFSTVIMILALAFRRGVLSLVFGNIEADVMENALVYFLTTALAYPFMAIYNAGAALFRSVGNSKISMLNSLIVNIVNITVNAVLIYGFDMGALGAGIGTLTSRIVAAVFILLLWQRRSNELRIIKLFKPEFHGRIVKQILSVGIPNGLENGMFQIGRLLVLSLITTFGTNVVAANAIGNSIAGVINVPGQAIGLAMVVVIGQCMGAGNTKQAVGYTKKLMLAVYVLMGALCVIQFVITDSLVGIFNLTPRAAAIASQVLRYSAVFTALIWPLSFDLPNSLRASGDVVFPMVISLVSMFVCRVGLSYVLACDWGLNLGLLGVWLAMFADWVVRSIFFIIRFARGKWKHKKVIG